MRKRTSVIKTTHTSVNIEKLRETCAKAIHGRSNLTDGCTASATCMALSDRLSTAKTNRRGP